MNAVKFVVWFRPPWNQSNIIIVFSLFVSLHFFSSFFFVSCFLWCLALCYSMLFQVVDGRYFFSLIFIILTLSTYCWSFCEIYCFEFFKRYVNEVCTQNLSIYYIYCDFSFKIWSFRKFCFFIHLAHYLRWLILWAHEFWIK